MRSDPWWFKIFGPWNWCSVWSTIDAGTTSLRMSLIWRYRRPSSVKKTRGCFTAFSVWRVAMILAMAGSPACACFTSSWEAIVMASDGGGV
uniref:Secreted protein n=1 Tax=Romanomermis culicivorax TaxID=13658 RepID=A0A915L383_ROMCU